MIEKTSSSVPFRYGNMSMPSHPVPFYALKLFLSLCVCLSLSLALALSCSCSLSLSLSLFLSLSPSYSLMYLLLLLLLILLLFFLCNKMKRFCMSVTEARVRIVTESRFVTRSGMQTLGDDKKQSFNLFTFRPLGWIFTESVAIIIITDTLL